MNIYEASLLLDKDYKIRRSSWDPREFIHNTIGMLEYVYVNKCHVVMEKINDKWQMITPNYLLNEFWLPDIEDLKATDWELYEENNV